MRRIRSWIGAALTTALLLSTGACADESGQQNLGNFPKAGSRGTVTIAIYPWVNYEANVAVVSRILETRLGYKVVTKKMGAPAAWPAMDAGEVDLVLENWGSAARKQEYIEQKKTVVALGPNGIKGVIGWYIPIWMAYQYSDIRDWHNLNKYAHLFATPETGGKGRLLDGDTTYLTNDSSIIANLGLNYTVTYSGSEDATVQAATAASKNHTPLLFYFWQPHWLFRQLKFAKISLPTYSPGCDSDPAKVACDYPLDETDKIASKKFVDRGGPALDFVKKFSWSNSDQNEVTDYLVNEKLSYADAADRWMEAHPDTWEAWL